MLACWESGLNFIGNPKQIESVGDQCFAVRGCALWATTTAQMIFWGLFKLAVFWASNNDKAIPTYIINFFVTIPVAMCKLRSFYKQVSVESLFSGYGFVSALRAPISVKVRVWRLPKATMSLAYDHNLLGAFLVRHLRVIVSCAMHFCCFFRELPQGKAKLVRELISAARRASLASDMVMGGLVEWAVDLAHYLDRGVTGRVYSPVIVVLSAVYGYRSFYESGYPYSFPSALGRDAALRTADTFAVVIVGLKKIAVYTAGYDHLRCRLTVHGFGVIVSFSMSVLEFIYSVLLTEFFSHLVALLSGNKKPAMIASFGSATNAKRTSIIAGVKTWVSDKCKLYSSWASPLRWSQDNCTLFLSERQVRGLSI